jgi:hypothetical protein
MRWNQTTNSCINIAYKTNNTIAKHLIIRKNNSSNSDRYDKSGIYRLKCSSCPRRYIGQTGRSFKVRYKEHINGIKYNRQKTGYSQHVLNIGHDRTHNITSLDIIDVHHKGPYLNTQKHITFIKIDKKGYY